MNYWILGILGVFLVAMIVMTIIPQKKRQKQQQEMMSSIAVGTKIMTIGRLVGKIVAVNSQDNTFTVNVGTEDAPSLITIEKNGIGVVLDPIQPAQPAVVEDAGTDPETSIEATSPAIDDSTSAAPAKKKPAKQPKTEEPTEEPTEAKVE